MRCAVYEVLLPLMMMITVHRQTHRNENSISASFTPFTNSLGGYNKPNSLPTTAAAISA